MDNGAGTGVAGIWVGKSVVRSVCRASANRNTANMARVRKVFFLTGGIMFSWAVVFLVVALLAVVFGFTALAGTAVHIAWILFVVGLFLFIVFAVLGRRSPLL